MYRELDHRRIIATAAVLAKRVDERFSASGLSQVSHELVAVAEEAIERLARLRAPHWPIRVLCGVAMLVLVGIAVAAVSMVPVRNGAIDLAELLQALDAAVNTLFFIGVAIYFLFTVEGRHKRGVALHALHELRSLAHIIDMHQMTKDPEHVFSPEARTDSSPERALTRFELARYLDYCSEMLSIISKLAALHVERLDDPVVLAAVDDIQGLADGLSAKIWQKIVIIDSIMTPRPVDPLSEPPVEAPHDPAPVV